MVSNSPTDRGQLLAEINIIPLVDIVLVLLIIFMITAPLLTAGLDVDLPHANVAGVDRTEQDLTLTIRKDGSLYLQDDTTHPLSFASLEKQLEEVYKRRKNKAIYLKADREIAYGVVVKVLAVLQRLGLDRVGMLTQPDTASTP